MSNELDLAEQLLQQAMEMSDQGNYKEALPMLHQVASITKDVRSARATAAYVSAPQSFDRETVDAYMAARRRWQAIEQRVEKSLEQILLLLEQMPDQPELGHCLHSLGKLYFMQHQYAQALPLYLRTLAIWEETLEPEDPNLIQCLTDTAKLLRTQEKNADARPLLERVLPIQEKQLGPAHPGIAGTLSALASVYFNQGEIAEATALYERALAIREIVPGPEDPITTTLVSNLAYVYLTQHEYTKALPLYERMLVVMEASIAKCDKIGGPSAGEHPILEIFRKNRDLCVAGIKLAPE